MWGTDLNSPFPPQVTYIYPWPNVPVNLVRACERRLQGCEDIGPGAGLPAENLDLPPSEQFFSKNVQFLAKFPVLPLFLAIFDPN